MPATASTGVVAVCDGTLTETVEGYLTCSVPWEQSDLGVFGVFDASQLSVADLGLMFLGGWGALMTIFAANWAVGVLIRVVKYS
jgi:hypothetical protein